MIPYKLLYVGLLLSSVCFFVIGFIGYKKWEKDKNMLSGIMPENTVVEQTPKGKHKQQVELELLLINNNPFLKFIATIDKNLKAKLLAIFFCCAVYWLFNIGSPISELSLPMILIFASVILVPSILTNTILSGKIKKIMTDMPGFIDLVAVNVQTGITIDASLKQVASDFRKLNPDLTHVMLRIIRKAELTGLSSALQDLAVSLPTTEIRMFCTVLQQSINFGSSMYPQLIQLSADIRELQLLTMEEKLGTLSAKMSVPLILFIMFPIIILILAPGVMRVFPNGVLN